MLEEEQKEEKEYLPRLALIMIKLKSLNKNFQFIKILKERKINNKYFVIYFSKDIINNNINKYLNISFVTKKKIGNAVIRNKIKRKLKSAVQQILNKKKIINYNYTYVIFGKSNVYKDKFALVLDEVSNAFKKIKKVQS